MASRVFAIPQRGLAQLVRANTSQARMDILDQNVAVKRVYANRPAWQVVSQSSLGCAAALAWALLTDRVRCWAAGAQTLAERDGQAEYGADARDDHRRLLGSGGVSAVICIVGSWPGFV